MVHPPTIIVLSITVLLLLGLTAVAWRYRAKSGAKMFGVLQGLSAVWAGLTVVGLSLPPGRLRLRVWGLTTGASLVVIAFWFAFIASYTGHDHLLSARRFGVASVPLAVGAGAYVFAPTWQPLVGRVTQETIRAGTVVQASVGPVGAVLGVYLYSIFLVGFGLVVKTMLEGNSLFVGQALALILGTFVTVLASFLGIVGVPTKGYPMTEVALAGQSLLWGYAVFGQQFLQVVPAVTTIGERVVFDELEDAVVVVDSDGTITRSNPLARSYLDADELVGRSLAPLLDRMEVSALADLPARFESQGRTYRTKASSVTNWRGETIGHALVIQDITPLVRPQQRLQVLNRVLRHNVRNDMNVVLGLAGRLRERDDERLREIGAKLSEKADDLTAISEKAIEIDRIFDTSTDFERVDLEAIVEGVVSSLAPRYPEATISTSLSADEMRTDSRILTLALEEVLTNALEHAGDAPEVRVEVTRGNDTVRIAVTDDGPGIPRAEIAPLDAGEETDLEHASSLGLWLVYWSARALGGDLDIATTEAGSTVSLSLPDAR